MADQQAGSRPPDEPLSYDADMLADVRGAYQEEAVKDTGTEAPAERAPAEEAQPTSPDAWKPDHPTDKARYADGTFKPTKTDLPAGQQTANEQQAKATREQQPQAQQQAAPQGGMPPPGWSVQSKAEWEKLPEHIRADVIKREQEVSNGFAQYQDVAELRDYAQLARNQGQSPRAVIERYMAAENYLRQDPINGLLDIARGLGIAPAVLAQHLSPLISGQSNGQTAQGYQQPALYDQAQASQQPAFDPAYLNQWINPLAQEVTNMRAYLQQQQQADQNRQMGAINGALEKFVADPSHRYFANVEDRIVQLFRSGAVPRTGDHAADLQSAYEMACLSDPELRKVFVSEHVAKDQAAKQQQQKEAAEKARHASRSITGSPSTGANRDFGDDDGSVEADVRRAYRAHVG